MNKKQALVTEILERLSVLDIPSEELYAKNEFWSEYPDGHYNSTIYPSIEGLLSCLTKDSLQAIVDKDYIELGKTFNSAWNEWGRAGYLQSVPEVIQDRTGVPILRLRHDCYLHWFRGYGFQNSYDAYCNGSNGESPKTFNKIREAITTDIDNPAEWNKTWALFRKAMVLSYPAQACAGKNVFYKMLNEHSDVFDDFITQTDKAVMRVGLDPSMTWNEMKEQASKQQFNCSIDLEVPIVLRNPKGESNQVCGILRFGKSSVSFTWSEDLQSRSMCINFPKWSAGDATLDTTATFLSQREYLLECWVNLGYTLLTMAGVICAPYHIALSARRNIDVAAVNWCDQDTCVTNIRTLNEVCSMGLVGALTK